MNENEKYKIAEFWPGAEKMLDDHFKTKQKIGLKYGLTALLVLITVGLLSWYFLTDSAVENKKLATSTNQKIELNNPSASTENSEINKSDVSIKSSLNNTENNKANNAAFKNGNNTETNNVNNTEINNVVNKVNNTETNNVNNTEINKDNNTFIQTSSPSHLNQGNKNNIQENFKNKINPVAANAAGNSESIINSALINSLSDGVGSSASTITADESSLKVGNKMAETTKNNNSPNSKKNSNQINGNDVATTNSSFVQFNKSFQTSEYAVLSPLKPSLTREELVTITSTQKSLTADFICYTKAKNKAIISYQLGAGIFNVSKSLSASAYPNYVSRRNSEEKATNYASWMLGAKIQFNHFAFNTGIEYNKYGEKVNYSNWIFENTNTINNSWSYTADSITTVSNYYIQGNQYDQTNVQFFTDSTLVTDSVTVYGQKAADVTEINSRTMISYIEIPLVIDYEIFKTKRFSAAIRTGVSIGFVQQKRGFYLDVNQEEFRDLNTFTTFRSTIWNARIGADFNYFIAPKTSVFIRPEFRTSLQSTFKTEAGIQQKYRAFGVMVGISKSF